MITKEKVLERLKTVVDPELNVNIVDLGLIYEVKISKSKKGEALQDVLIKMTLTTPGCPLSMFFEEWVTEAVKKIKGVKNVKIDLVWEPVWNPDKMTEEAREKVGLL